MTGHAVMSSCDKIRQSFLDYFKARDHEIVPSSLLVPDNDPTLLFTNAGMVQFKDIFLGHEKRRVPRVATAQRCIRVGGKHNDLEHVGYTTRHHTFFEMLGNFSFGDYFKKEAIYYAWDYLTGTLAIPEERLSVTVYRDDDEATSIWLDTIGIAAERLKRCGEQDNFWSMGDTGPCGPCSEIFYDHGADQDSERYTEIWNLVFTQYNRDKAGHLTPIPHPSVDTGMGLERIAAVMQGVHSNYEINLFRALVDRVYHLVGQAAFNITSSRVIADHIRACCFLISDGILPSNEGRGYVLRRIIRRAVRHGYKMGLEGPFFHTLVDTLAQQMGDAYPVLIHQNTHIEKVLLDEENRFSETLGQGLRRIKKVLQKLDGKLIPGEEVFRLYDTYGFPVDLTADVAREHGLGVDMPGFNREMDKQRQRARLVNKFDIELPPKGEEGWKSQFNGYHQLRCQTTVLGLYQDGRAVASLGQGAKGGVCLMETPFYAQAGGQVGDTGQLTTATACFNVEDTQKQGQAHIHLGRLHAGTLKIGDVVQADVNAERRQNIRRNHSATHLLHAALRKELGEHVVQKGSLVGPDHLRFDFLHHQPIDRQTLHAIEQRVNEQILHNGQTVVQEMALEAAKQSGAISLFSERYDDPVRVLSIGGEFSKELCGGTHVDRAGDIGLFKLISESGIAAGVRRVEAITGQAALAWLRDGDDLLHALLGHLKTNKEKAVARLEQQMEHLRKLEKEVGSLRGKLARLAGDKLAKHALDIAGVKVLANILDKADHRVLREVVERLKNSLGSAVLVLAAVSDDNKISLVAGVTQDQVGHIRAVDLVNFVAEKVGGKGGGRPDLAQAGGDKPAGLDAALSAVPVWVRTRLEKP